MTKRLKVKKVRSPTRHRFLNRSLDGFRKCANCGVELGFLPPGVHRDSQPSVYQIGTVGARRRYRKNQGAFWRARPFVCNGRLR